MRYYLSILLFAGLVFGQSDSELVKMLDNFKNKIRFGYYHNSNEKEWVDISLPPNLDWKEFNL